MTGPFYTEGCHISQFKQTNKKGNPGHSSGSQPLEKKNKCLNSETWIGLTKNHIEELEKVDQFLLKGIFEAPVSTSTK